jgi:tetratricopeptide (TPR) repeat protein
VDLGWLTVRLDAPGAQGQGQTAAVTVGGDFSFLSVPEGIYTLRVVNIEGDEILSQPVTVGPANAPLSLQLPRAVAARPAGVSTSVAQLRHRPNRRALEAARKAQGLSQSGAYERAAAQWKKAVEADPEFSEAHGNLGAQYARLKRPAEAAEEFQKAIALDPATAHHQSNLALVLAQLGRLDEAESWARRAVKQENSNPTGHYVLGCILTWRAASTAEAIQELRTAARQLPRAHQVLAEIYRVQGNEALAMAERKQFQEASQTESAARTDQWSTHLH